MHLMTATVIDPTTRSGFLEIADSHGREAAHAARVGALRGRLAAAEAADFRWFAEAPRKALQAAEFNAVWEATNPDTCRIMREAGIGY